MLNCPICGTQNSKELDECKNCGWDLSLLSYEGKTPQEIFATAISSYNKIWRKLTQSQTEQETQGQTEQEMQVLNTTEFNPEDLKNIVQHLETRLGKLEAKDIEEGIKLSDVLDHQQKLKSNIEKKIDLENQKNLESFRRLKQEIKETNDIKTNKSDFQPQFEYLTKQSEKQSEEQIKLTQEFKKQLSQIELNISQQIEPLLEKIKIIEDFNNKIKPFFERNKRVNSTKDNTSSHLEYNKLSNDNTNVSVQESEDHNQFGLTWEEHQLVEEYNHDFPDLLEKITEVSETQKSISDRSLGASRTVILEEKSGGMYGILTQGNYHYLVPSRRFRITDSNYKTVEALFKCHNYQTGYSEKFNLLKPATVITLPGNQQWQVKKTGILEF